VEVVLLNGAILTVAVTEPEESATVTSLSVYNAGSCAKQAVLIAFMSVALSAGLLATLVKFKPCTVTTAVTFSSPVLLVTVAV